MGKAEPQRPSLSDAAVPGVPLPTHASRGDGLPRRPKGRASPTAAPNPTLPPPAAASTGTRPCGHSSARPLEIR